MKCVQASVCVCVKRTLKLASLCLMYNGLVLKRGKAARLISSYVLSLLCLPRLLPLLLVPPPTSSLWFLPFQRQDGEDLVVKGVEEEVTTEALSPSRTRLSPASSPMVSVAHFPKRRRVEKNTVSKADGVLSSLSKVQNVQKKISRWNTCLQAKRLVQRQFESAMQVRGPGERKKKRRIFPQCRLEAEHFLTLTPKKKTPQPGRNRRPSLLFRGFFFQNPRGTVTKKPSDVWKSKLGLMGCQQTTGSSALPFRISNTLKIIVVNHGY